MRKKEHVEEHELELKRMELHCYAASCVMVNRPPKRVIYYLHDAGRQIDLRRTDGDVLESR